MMRYFLRALSASTFGLAVFFSYQSVKAFIKSMDTPGPDNLGLGIAFVSAVLACILLLVAVFAYWKS